MGLYFYSPQELLDQNAADDPTEKICKISMGMHAILDCKHDVPQEKTENQGVDFILYRTVGIHSKLFTLRAKVYILRSDKETNTWSHMDNRGCASISPTLYAAAKTSLSLLLSYRNDRNYTLL